MKDKSQVIITTAELQRALAVLCKHLEEMDQAEIKLPAHLYWSVTPDQLYNPCEEPDELALGNLGDDWDHIVRIAQGHDEPITYAFVWLAEVLRAVGHSAKE